MEAELKSARDQVASLEAAKAQAEAAAKEATEKLAIAQQALEAARKPAQ
jgi:hypothetical protein